MRTRFLACGLAALVLSSTPAAAQNPSDDRAADAPEPQKPDSADAKKPPTPEHTGIRALFRNLGEDYKNLAHMDNLVVAGIGGGAALAVHPWDQQVNAHLRSHYD